MGHGQRPAGGKLIHSARPWVRAYREALLAGQTDAVITTLEAEANDPTCPATQRQAVRRTIGS